MSCPGHRGYDDFRLRKKNFDPLDERDGADYFSDGCSVDPNGFFEGESWQKSHPLNQLPSETRVDNASEQEIRRSENKEKREKDVVE
jgi:hypothetical protein